MNIPSHKKDKRYSKSRFVSEIKRVMAARNITLEQLADITGLKPRTIMSAKKGFPKEDKDQIPIPLDHMALLHFVLRVDPTKLLLPKEKERQILKKLEEDYWEAKEKAGLEAKKNATKRGEVYEKPLEKNVRPFEKRYFTHDTWEELKKVWRTRRLWNYYHHFDSSSKGNNTEIVKAYGELIEEFIKPAEKEIRAHELLFKGNSGEPDDYQSYNNAQKLIYKTIEEKLRDSEAAGKKFTYKRVFYLDPSDRLYSKSEKDQNSILIAFMGEISTIALEHVYRCLTQFPNRCDFQVVLDNTSYRQNVIIDQEILLIEEYMYKHRTAPETLFAFDVSEASSGYRLLKDFNKTTSERIKKAITLNSDEMHLYLRQASNYVEAEINMRHGVLDYMRSDGQKFLEFLDFVGKVKDTLTLYETQKKTLLDKQKALYELGAGDGLNIMY